MEFNYTRPLRISVLSHGLRVAGGRSVGRNIVTALPEAAKNHEYLFTVPEGAGYPDFPGHSNIRVFPVRANSFISRLSFETSGLCQLLDKFKPDLVWALGNTGIQRSNCRQTLLVHDAHLCYPAKHYSLETGWYKFRKQLVGRRLAGSLKWVDMLFCQTETMKKRLVEKFRYTGPVRIMPAAVSKFSTTNGKAENAERLRGFGGQFKMLVLTKYCAHKNLESLVETYRRFRNELSGTLCVLTIALSDHPNAEKLLRQIYKLGLEDHIYNIGPLKQEQLADYFAACDAVLLPTLLESFSSTYLEAMHFGKPILTSELDFAREVCAEAALFFNPWSPMEIKEAITRLRDDLPLREKLVEAGTKRIKGHFYSWLDIVRKALDDMGIPYE